MHRIKIGISTCCVGFHVQLDWPWIAEWAYAGIFAVAGVFKTKTSFGFLIKKIRRRFFYFFQKSKNELVRPKTMFLVILAKI